MKIQCKTCGSVVEDVAGVCPVCGMLFQQQVNTQPVYTELTTENRMMGSQIPPYNYQNPMGSPSGQKPKKKLLSILSIVLAAVGILTMCIPWLSALFCIAAIVLGIIALVKKEIKVPAILGLVFGGIMGIISTFFLIINLMLQLVIGTGFMGIIQQSMDAVTEGYTQISNVSMELPIDGESVSLTLSSDGRYYSNGALGSGYYWEYGYVDLSTDDELSNYIVCIMSEGYEIKDLTIVELQSMDEYGTGNTTRYAFVVPEGYTPGSVIYYIDATDDSSYEDIELETVLTLPIG